MIVVFIVVLVVFGPHKLPELARGLGKLMAEFRKASTDFKTAFEEEMRDLERQAREVGRNKIATTPAATEAEPPALETPTEAQTVGDMTSDAQTLNTPALEPVIATVAESVPRSSEQAAEEKTDDVSALSPVDSIHDHQKPA